MQNRIRIMPIVNSYLSKFETAKMNWMIQRETEERKYPTITGNGVMTNPKEKNSGSKAS
jgi:hypothetical protein